MPNCESCGGYVLAKVRNCPGCGMLVNPAGQNPLVSDQLMSKAQEVLRNIQSATLSKPEPKTCNAPRQGKKTITTKFIVQGIGLKSLPNRTVRDTARETVSSTSRAAPARENGSIQLHFESNDKAVFRLSGAAGKVISESVSFRQAPLGDNHDSQEARGVLRMFIADLKASGWKQEGQGKKWYELKFVRVARSQPHTSIEPRPTKEPKQNLAPGSPINTQGTRSIEQAIPATWLIEQTIQLHIRQDGKGVFLLHESNKKYRIRESDPFSLNFKRPELVKAEALAVHKRFIERLESTGWKQVKTGDPWYEVTMRKTREDSKRKKGKKHR